MCARALTIVSTVLTTSLLLGGCQTLSSESSAALNTHSSSEHRGQFTPGHQQMIAENLVYALSQLPETQPLGTTIQLSAPDTPFGEVLIETLASAGYGQQYVEGDIGLNVLRYLVENAETETGFHTRYKVDIGDISVEREYILKQGRLLPDSGLRVGGSNASLITLNDDMFVVQEGETIDSTTTTLSTDIPVIRQIAADDLPSGSNLLLDRVQIASIGIPNEEANTNFFERTESKYASVLQQYEEISSDVLIFPNDSLRLGQTNRAIVEQVARKFNPSTEVISVVGCSLGKTAIADGNRFLALGRASRVREALVIAGIEGASIFDEGCWDGAHLDQAMPRRGVILSVKRIRSNDGSSNS